VQAARLVPFAEDAPALRRLLDHRDWFMRAEAPRALAAQRDPAAFDATKRLLADEEDGARSEAIEALADLGDCDPKAVARRHAAADDGRAIGAHDDAVVRPARRCEIQRPGAHVRLQLSRAAEMRKTE
jgi:HEAT repeat protein